ncbi:hypothetical protein ACFYSC_10250 [Streptosporangium sp. NPDC004379]|uniref:hypothetical protein n=1 Tax=Streptosporangium sp. NPDC004379 TaxID=3366189 RepID=UPI00367D92CD
MAGERDDIIETGRPEGARRRAGAGAGIAVLLVLAAVTVSGLLSGPEPGEVPPSPPSRPSPPSAAPTGRSSQAPSDDPAPNVLRPRTRHRGGREILDLVFPDGTAAELSYPAGLGLAELGVRPAYGGWPDGRPGLFRLLVAPSGGPERDGSPIRSMAERVTLWPPVSPAEGDVLLFDFAPWYVALHDSKEGMAFEDRLLWARGLRGRTTGNGYLVLTAGPPLRLARPGELFGQEPAGPQLWFGGARETLVVMAPMPGCDAGRIRMAMIGERRRFSAETCRDGVYVAASGERGHVERVIDGVRFRLGRTPVP